MLKATDLMMYIYMYVYSTRTCMLCGSGCTNIAIAFKGVLYDSSFDNVLSSMRLSAPITGSSKTLR